MVVLLESGAERFRSRCDEADMAHFDYTDKLDNTK
jgi:hypothetical protein